MNEWTHEASRDDIYYKDMFRRKYLREALYNLILYVS